MNLIGRAADPLFWTEKVRLDSRYESFRKYLFDTYAANCEKDEINEIRYSHFKLFFDSGDRSVYESQYFKRRRALASASLLSLIYPEEEKYLIKLMDVIFAILNEYTWCLPAHYPNPDGYHRTFIDLFAAETGMALSYVYVLLENRLDPLIRERIQRELQYRIFDAFLTKKDHWWETRGTNNWSSVCAGSVGCAMMMMRPELFEELKERFDAIMERYLSGFYDDGFCLEGTGYWHYGFGFFTVYADMLKTFTGGSEDYFKREKVKTISTFIQKMFLCGNEAVSFADGHSKLEYHLGLCHYLKKLYPDAVKVYDPSLSYIADNCARYCLILNYAVWLDDDIYDNPENNNSAEYYAENAQWLVKRTESYGFAAKGGNNGEHHNHNDVGSFIFAKDGKQLLVDLGAGKYTRQYFRGETRYGFIECSSLGHSVPFFGNEAQKTGAAYKATDLKYKLGSLSFDMAEAYGIPELKSLTREFQLTESSLTLTDSFDYCGNEDITERFVTRLEPVLCDNAVKVGSATLIYSLGTPSVSSVKDTKNQTVYFIDFKLPANTKEFSVKIR